MRGRGMKFDAPHEPALNSSVLILSCPSTAGAPMRTPVSPTARLIRAVATPRLADIFPTEVRKMKLQTGSKSLMRCLYAVVLTGLLYSILSVNITPAGAQYPYGCSCTGLYSDAHTTCDGARGGLTYFTCNYTGTANYGSYTCADGTRWTNSCSY